MSVMAKAKLEAGVIYGDKDNGEYVYMPASEIGVSNPLCVFEAGAERRDITLAEAVTLITRLSLRPTVHPRLGTTSC